VPREQSEFATVGLGPFIDARDNDEISTAGGGHSKEKRRTDRQDRFKLGNKGSGAKEPGKTLRTHQQLRRKKKGTRGHVKTMEGDHDPPA